MAEHTQLEHEAAVREAGGSRLIVRYAKVYDEHNHHLGDLQVEFCEACGKHVATACEHNDNVWNEEGTVLSCRACGTDVT